MCTMPGSRRWWKAPSRGRAGSSPCRGSTHHRHVAAQLVPIAEAVGPITQQPYIGARRHDLPACAAIPPLRGIGGREKLAVPAVEDDELIIHRVRGAEHRAVEVVHAVLIGREGV